MKRDNRSHWKVERYDPETYKPIYKAKKPFNCEKEAILEAFKLNCSNDNFSQYVAYKCSFCNNWHIGRTNKKLSMEDKLKYAKKLEYQKTH